MKGKLALLLILIFLFGGFILVKFFIFDKKADYGQLKINSSPTTSIFINNVVIGKTPFYDKYKVGEYILKLIPEGTATETASWQGKITVFKSSLTYVNRELGSSDISSSGEILTTTKMDHSSKNANQGEIYIESEPQGVIINLDNDEKGVAPMIIEDIPRGEHELSVFMPGFFRRTQKINIDSGYRVSAFFKLAIDQSQSASQNKTKKEATSSAQIKAGNQIKINDTPTGWLRVREEPSIDATESAKIKSGQIYELLDEKDNWYKIKFNGDKDGLVDGSFTQGWISREYATKE